MKKLPARLKSPCKPYLNRIVKASSKIWRAATIILFFTLLLSYSFTLTPVFAQDCGVAGTVTNSAGEPVPNTFVAIHYPLGTLVGSAWTDSSGSYAISSLPCDVQLTEFVVCSGPFLDPGVKFGPIGSGTYTLNRTGIDCMIGPYPSPGPSPSPGPNPYPSLTCDPNFCPTGSWWADFWNRCDRDSRPAKDDRRDKCNICNLTNLKTLSCAESFTVFDEVKWQRKERDLVCEGDDWKITPWDGTVIVDPSQTTIPFVGKKGNEEEKLYLADYFEGTHDYYRTYPLFGGLIHGVSSTFLTNFQGVLRKLTPMGYQDTLKKEMVQRAQNTSAGPPQENGVHDYQLNYVKRLCWDAPLWAEVLKTIAEKLGLDIPEITHYCLFRFNLFDDGLIEAVKIALDEFNSRFPLFKIPYFYQEEAESWLADLVPPPEPSEENYVEKWNVWKESEWGRLWEVAPMVSREDTPGDILPYLGRKRDDKFEILNPEAQIEKVPHVARLYETSQEINKIMTPLWQKGGTAQKETGTIIASAEENVLGEKVYLAQAASCSRVCPPDIQFWGLPPAAPGEYSFNSQFCVPCSNCNGVSHLKNLRISDSGGNGGWAADSGGAETQCPRYHDTTWGTGYSPSRVRMDVGSTFAVSISWEKATTLSPTGCCVDGGSGSCAIKLIQDAQGNYQWETTCGVFPSPPPACGLAEPLPVYPCQLPAITDTNPNDDLCCEPININLEAKDMFNDYPYTPCDYSCGPTGTDLCNPECNTWEYRTVNRKIGINLLHPYLSEIWNQTTNSETFGIFNYFRPASIPEFSDIDAASQINYSYDDTSDPKGGSVTPETGKFYYPYLGGVQLAKQWLIQALTPYKE